MTQQQEKEYLSELMPNGSMAKERKLLEQLIKDNNPDDCAEAIELANDYKTRLQKLISFINAGNYSDMPIAIKKRGNIPLGQKGSIKSLKNNFKHTVNTVKSTPAFVKSGEWKKPEEIPAVKRIPYTFSFFIYNGEDNPNAKTLGSRYKEAGYTKNEVLTALKNEISWVDQFISKVKVMKKNTDN